MKIAGRRQYLTSLESVAMTDIVMNMFIFFFISFSLLYTFSPQRTQKLDLKLPKASSAGPVDNKEQANIIITSENLLYLDKEMVTLKELKEKIRSRYRKNSELSVILSADRLVRFKEIVGILDVLNDLGIKNLNIAAAKE